MINKVITDTFLYLKNNIERQIFHGLKSQLKQNLFCFKKDFWACKEKLEEMRHEQSREAYEFLCSYYTNIELNKEKAFHWLKKMSYFECTKDIRLLIRCYSFGDGCEQDHILAEKLRCKYNENKIREEELDYILDIGNHQNEKDAYILEIGEKSNNNSI